VALVTYAPLGTEAPSAIQYMFDYQSVHNAKGAPTRIGDEIYHFPAWWTLLLFQWQLYGTFPILSLGAAVVIALLRPRPLELYLLAAILVPFLFLSFYISFKLHHYVYTWQAPVILLLALAAGKLTRRGITGGIFAILLLLAPFFYLGVDTVKTVSHTEPGNYSAVAEHLKATGHDRDTILVYSLGPVVKAYLPEARVINSSDRLLRRSAAQKEIDVVIVDSDVSERRPSPEIDRYLANNSDALSLTYTTDDKQIKSTYASPTGRTFSLGFSSSPS